MDNLKSLLGGDRFKRLERVHEHYHKHVPTKAQWGLELTLMMLIDDALFQYEHTADAATLSGHTDIPTRQ